MIKTRVVTFLKNLRSKRLQFLSEIAIAAKKNNDLNELVETATNPNLKIPKVEIRIVAISRVEELVESGRKLTMEMIKKISTLAVDEKNFPINVGNIKTSQDHDLLRDIASSIVTLYRSKNLISRRNRTSLPPKPAKRAI